VSDQTYTPDMSSRQVGATIPEPSSQARGQVPLRGMPAGRGVAMRGRGGGELARALTLFKLIVSYSQRTSSRCSFTDQHSERSQSRSVQG